MMLIWMLLPPIFVVCGFLALAAPYLVRKKDVNSAERQHFTDRAAVAERLS